MSKPIKTYSLEEIEDIVLELGQPRFRAKQLSEWIYSRCVSSYDEMTNIPLKLRQDLQNMHPLYVPKIIDKQVSFDGTKKYVLEYFDGTRVETVGMPSSSSDGKERLTVCFSTQAGCAMGCTFCATGHEGFSRNLSLGEMFDQIAIVQKDFERRVSNVVAMGQGEPFLNYDHVISALRLMNNPAYGNIGARHIAISTCGVLSGIEKLAEEPEQFTLAISLHAARQEVRNILMPAMANQPLKQLKKTLIHYIANTNRRVTFEYLMIDGINDTDEDLAALKKFCEGLLCHVNLLPMNKVESSPFSPSPSPVVKAWQEELSSCHIETTVRKSRGSDIAGACGQLKNSLT